MKFKSNDNGLFGFLFAVGVLTAIGIYNNKRKFAGVGKVGGINFDETQRVIGNQIDDFSAFVNHALEDKKFMEDYTINIVDFQRKRLKRLIGEDIKYVVINASEIRHMNNRHVGDREKNPDNVPMTIKDLYSIPEILNIGQIKTEINTNAIDGVGAAFSLRTYGVVKIVITLQAFLRKDDDIRKEALRVKSARIEKCR